MHPQDELQALRARVQLLEDRFEVLGLISRYALAADTADGAAAAGLWAEDGVLEVAGELRGGPAAVFAMIDSDGQRALVERGCAHVQSLPSVQVDGDRATATGYGRVYVHGDDGFEVWRVSVNDWAFRRTDHGWRVTRRAVQLVDGRPEARRLLHRPLD